MSASNVDGELMRWSRRHARRWIALLLPGLLLRAFVPIGFMPMFGPHFRVQLTLCEAYAAIPAASMHMSSMDVPMDMPLAAPQDAPRPVHAHQDHGHCPYGTGPALATLATLSASSASIRPSVAPPLADPQIFHFNLAPRAQSPRGPPLPA